MDIRFEKDYLRELYYEGQARDEKHRFRPQIVKKFIRVIDLMESLDTTEDLFRFKSLNYESLTGNKQGLESVRINDQYRIEFFSVVGTKEPKVTILNITELSNHYK